MMTTFLICGNVNVETNLRVDSFPVQYNPAQFVFFGIQTNPSGVGYNIAKSLKTLGNEVVVTGMIGDDVNAAIVRAEMQSLGIDDKCLLPLAAGTMQSVILYDADGKRQIFSDLKNVQDLSYPLETFRSALTGVDVCVMTNLNFSRKLLDSAKNMGKLVACDVQALQSLDDDYNRDFMQAADILFFSNDRLGEHAEATLREAAERYPAQVIVAGMGAQGVMMFVREDHWFGALPAYNPRPVVNTVGAGDALFSSFLHFYWKKRDAQEAIRKAMLYAGWKIGESGGARGFLTEAEVDQMYNERTHDSD